MGKRLPVPPDLEHLIEKRDHDEDRRQKKQRGGSDQRQADFGPLGAIESAKNLQDVPSEERRAGNERRKQKDRRKKPRRSSGS